ncbi:Small ribosomal subunit protein [Trichinella pseudospiralis]
MRRCFVSVTTYQNAPRDDAATVADLWRAESLCMTSRPSCVMSGLTTLRIRKGCSTSEIVNKLCIAQTLATSSVSSLEEASN